MQMPRLTPYTQTLMQERFSEGIPRSLEVPTHEREGFTRDVAAHVHAGAVNVCNRLFGPEHGCAARLSRFRIHVLPHSRVFNAGIDGQKRIYVFGGLVRKVGSRDELASVLAHEYAHGLMNHPQRSARNRALGMMIGAAVGATVGEMTDDENDTGDYADAGMRIGLTIGNRVYSQAMENEADHLGLFIMNEAGFDLRAASHMFMRMMNERRFIRNDLYLRSFYLRTHPGEKERIQKLVSAEKMIEGGQRKPQWKR